MIHLTEFPYIHKDGGGYKEQAFFESVWFQVYRTLRGRTKAPLWLFEQICSTQFGWSIKHNQGTQYDPANLRINSDINRYEMFHHFVSADIIINSNSEFSHVELHQIIC
jgi:hypothetical protein